MKQDDFGALPDGTPVAIYTLTNTHGIEARLITYGAILVSLKTPDRSGELADVVLGFDSLDGYLTNAPHFGATIGRYGNRIANGRFAIGEVTYQLTTNDGRNHVHGGFKGFDQVIWQAEPLRDPDTVGVAFSYRSKDGEEGYPGNLAVTVCYRLTNANELRLDYEAVTDRATPINLTNHSYWALAGPGRRDILDHELTLDADKYAVVDERGIPTGELREVKGTPFDFTRPHVIGERIARVPGGYDHNYVVRRSGTAIVMAARVHAPTTGRVMEIATIEPGIQLYTGNFLDGRITGKGGHSYQQRAGLCLETQHFPDSPNHPGFPSTILEPGQTYRTTTIHRFSTR